MLHHMRDVEYNMYNSESLAGEWGPVNIQRDLDSEHDEESVFEV